MALASTAQSRGVPPRSHPAMNAAAKESPAPTVSTTGTEKPGHVLDLLGRRHQTALATKFQHDDRGTECQERLDELHSVLDRREKPGLGLGEQQDVCGGKRPFALLAGDELDTRAGIEKDRHARRASGREGGEHVLGSQEIAKGVAIGVQRAGVLDDRVPTPRGTARRPRSSLTPR